MNKLEIQKLSKLVVLIFLAWVVATYIPNALLRNWIFLLFVFADFYFSAQWVRKTFKTDLWLNTAMIGLTALAIVSVIFNRIGF